MSARLFACLLPVLFCWTVASPAAAEQPVPPVLLGTNPPSSADAPASSTTPVVLGESEPRATPVSAPLDRSVLITSALNPTAHPNYVIEIFAGEDCGGSAIGHATAGTFDAEGIAVSVAPDQVTILSAQVDPGSPLEPSYCSGPLFYWEGNVSQGATDGGSGGGSGQGGGAGDGASPAPGSIGPATPAAPVTPLTPRIHTDPGGVANDTTPVILGSAQGAESVLVYTSEGCRGTPVARGSAGQLQSGFQVSVTPNATTVFSAAAIIGGRSTCSEPVAYTDDSTAPRTRITMGPGVKTRKRKAVFRFQDITEDPPGTSFACKVDKKRWKPCASPFRLKHLQYGRHLVKVRATDLAGNREPKPVKRRFKVLRAGRL